MTKYTAQLAFEADIFRAMIRTFFDVHEEPSAKEAHIFVCRLYKEINESDQRIALAKASDKRKE